VLPRRKQRQSEPNEVSTLTCSIEVVVQLTAVILVAVYLNSLGKGCYFDNWYRFRNICFDVNSRVDLIHIVSIFLMMSNFMMHDDGSGSYSLYAQLLVA
jgi:hypothetical protein